MQPGEAGKCKHRLTAKKKKGPSLAQPGTLLDFTYNKESLGYRSISYPLPTWTHKLESRRVDPGICIARTLRKMHLISPSQPLPLSDSKYQTCAFLCFTRLFQGLASCEAGAQLVARPLTTWANASTSLGRGKSLAGPCTGHREGAAGNGQKQRVPYTLEAPAPTQALVCSLLPQADPAPPATNHGAPHWAAHGHNRA